MKTYEDVIQTYTTQKVIRTTCDKCGVDIESPSSHEINDFQLTYEEGYSYASDGGYKTIHSVDDLCDDCIEKLFTILRDNGFAVTTKEVDW